MSDPDTHLPSLKQLLAFGPRARLRSAAAVSPEERGEISAFKLDADTDVFACEQELAACDVEAKKLRERYEMESAKLRGQYEADSARLQVRALQLQRKRRQIGAQLTLCDSLVSPARRLPMEVLSLIFALSPANDLMAWEYLDEGEGDSGIPTEWIMPGRVFGRVCWRWRRAALSTPALWSKIDVALTYRADLRSQEALMGKIVGVLLERSKAHPLDLRVQMVDSDIRGHPAWDYLMSQRSRWQRIHLWLSYEALYALPDNRFADFNGESSPMLKGVYLGESIDASFMNCPRLISVFLAGNLTTKTKLPNQQILHLHLRDCALEDIQDVFQSFIHARHITLDLSALFQSDAVQYILPKQCVSFTLDASDYDEHELILSCFICPTTLTSLSLRDPELLDIGYPITLSFAEFQTFLIQANCTLTSMTLDGIAVTPEAFLQILRLVPSLTHLTFHEIPS